MVNLVEAFNNGTRTFGVRENEDGDLAESGENVGIYKAALVLDHQVVCSKLGVITLKGVVVYQQKSAYLPRDTFVIPFCSRD